MKKLLLSLSMVLFAVSFALAQRTVTGMVTDSDSEPLIGASILVKGTSSGTVTDIDGKYSIKVPEGSNMLTVSYTGYEEQAVAVGASNVVDIMLSEGVTLDELVVTALGISREQKSLGYAVQEIGGDELSDSRETNVVNSLQGKIAGVQIQGSPSTLGGSSRITIRGANSFLGENQPLFVVDGIPIDNSNFSDNSQQRGFGDDTAPYDYGNMAQDINPENIASLTVLKGGAASALYGSRGANGVIIITTKDGSGQKKGLGVEVNSSIAWDQVNNLLPHQSRYGGGDILDTESGFDEVIIDGVTQLVPIYAKDGSWGPKLDGQMVRHWDSWDPQSANFGELRPWSAPSAGYEEFFETGVTVQNGVAISGASDKASFRMGYTNLDQSGTLPNAELQRNSLSFNSSLQATDKLKVNIVGNYVRTDAENRNVTGYNNANPLQAFTQWWQTQLDVDRLRNSEWTSGQQNTWNSVGVTKDANNNFLGYNADPRFFDNPFWVRDNYLQEDTRNRFYGNINLTYELTENLSVTGRTGTDFYQFSTRQGIPIASVETAEYSEVERRFQENNTEVRLNYNNTFGDFSLNGSVGGNSMRQFVRSTTSQTVGGLSLENYYNIRNSRSNATVETDEANKAINSVFAFASLGYKNFLYLDVTGRNDWSSTLDPNNNSFFYPSASVSAVFTDMPGVDLGVISFAKARVSWAQVGNDTDPYRVYDVYDPQIPNQGTFSRYSLPNAKNNLLLQNELTTEYEVGIDVRLFKNRLGIDAAYYTRTTVDQIFEVPASATTGFTSRFLNAGEMRNSGIELVLSGTPIKTNDFSWDLGVNFTTLNNEVVSLADGVESIAIGGTWAADLRVAEGFGYMALFGQDYIRENYEEDAEGNITRNEGRPTVNEDGIYNFTDERVYLGSAIADFVGGISTALNYKGFSLSALLDFQKGGVVHSTSLQWAKYSGMLDETVTFNGVDDIRETGLILPGVKADGSENDIAIMDPQNNYFQSQWRVAAPNVYDASFLKLREVRLGYTLPNSVFGNTSLRDMRISVYGRNLAILSADLPHLDPQGVNGAGNAQGLENAQIPSTRTIGVNLSFKL